MAVTPDSSLMKRTQTLFIGKMLRWHIELGHAAAPARQRGDDRPPRVARGLIFQLKLSPYCQSGKPLSA
jgi:hypothetical protein